MGKGSRLRKQKMSKEAELTNAKQDPKILKANVISQCIVDESNAYYTPDGKLMINMSRETSRADLNRLTTELAKVGINPEFSYHNIQRGEIIVAPEPLAEDYIDDINASVSTAEVNIDVDKLIELKNKYDYSIKFDDASLIMNLPFDDITINVTGPRKYKERIIVNKTEIQHAIKEINRGNKVWGTKIVGYAILYDNGINPDEWVIGVPIHLYKSYKTKKGICYQLAVNIADGIFAVSNDYEIRKKFRFYMIEYLVDKYPPQLLKGMTLIWNSLVRAISDPEMKDQWNVEQFTNKNGSILTKYTQIGLEEPSRTMETPGDGTSDMDSTIHKLFIEKIDDSNPQSEIIASGEKLSEIIKKQDIDLFENEVDTYMKSPYDDFIMTMDDNSHYRVILYKEEIKSVTEPYMYNRRYSKPVGIIMAESHEYSDCTIFGVLSFEKFLDRLDVFKLTINPYIGLSIYDHDETKINEFQKIIQTGSGGVNDTTIFLTFITILPTVIKALNNPEIKEIWETEDVKIGDNSDLKKYYTKRPLENIKRVYMCEHAHIDREIEHHTDKWFVRGHEVHMKNGTTYFRRGYYKGPARLDDRIIEPRKRTLNTVCDDVKKDLDDFYNLLK
jgi:hypothetical protein